MPPKAAGTLLPEDLYRRAIALGRTAAGVSGPNPPVGCVIVHDGQVVGEGATAATGGPHAEIVALSGAGSRADGAVAIVTLEPCAHRGRTGPCTEALIAAGISEVHLLLRDPDPQAAGGIERLRAAGVHVIEVGAHLPELLGTVRHDLRGFIARVQDGRPHVTLKLAQTADGRTAAGAPRYLTGSASRSRVHELRARVDAVLVGSATVRADDPQLDVRHTPAAAGPVRQPRPVVLATDADIDPAAHVVRRGALVLVGERASSARCTALTDAGATIVRVPSSSGGAGLDLDAALAALLEHRILTVLAEPGPVLADALLERGLVDAVELHLADAMTPGDLVPALPRLAWLIDWWRVGAEERPIGTGWAVEVDTDGLEGDVILRASSMPSSVPSSIPSSMPSDVSAPTPDAVVEVA